MLCPTSNRQFRASGDELQVPPAAGRIILGHDVDEIMDRTALDVEPMVGLDRLAQSYKSVGQRLVLLHMQPVLTLSGPVLVGVAKEHDELVGSERLQVVDREDLGEALSECSGLLHGALA
jgi:hypothetical protein